MGTLFLIRENPPDGFCFNKAFREGINGLTVGNDGNDMLLALIPAEEVQPLENGRVILCSRRADQRQIPGIGQAGADLIVQRLFPAVIENAPVIQRWIRQSYIGGQPVRADAFARAAGGCLILPG